MRILHLISTLNPEFGGPVEAIKQLGLSFARRGVQAEIAICKDQPGDSWLAKFPLPTHALGPARGYYGYTPRLRPWLERHGREYDLWVLNGLWQFQTYGAAKVAWRLGQPYFVYSHGMLDPWSRRAHPLKFLKKLAYWLPFERRVLARARALCFTAQEEARLAATYFGSAPWKPFVPGAGVAPPPIPDDAAVAKFIERFPALRGKRIWTFLGRLHEKKALDIVLLAFARVAASVPDVHLVIAGMGDPAYVASLVKLAERLEITSRVSFVGPVYHEEKWACFKVSELFVLPSHQENFGIAVAEALAMRVPVCISDQINIWREIDDDKAGLVCHDTLESFEKCLRCWIALNEDERRAYGERALECYDRHFRVDEVTNRLLARFTAELAR